MSVISIGFSDGIAFSQLLGAAAWKGAVLAALILVIARIPGLRRAASRHALWTAALSALIVLPLLEATLSWRMELAAPALAHLGAVRGGLEGSSALSAPGLLDVAAPPRPDAATVAWGKLIPWVWALGASVVLLRTLYGRWAAHRLVVRARPVTDAAWLGLARNAAARLRVPPVPLMLSDRVDLPFTTGLFRPVIVLPADSEEWTQERQNAVLLHELAHVRRRDVAVQLVAQLACALHWFNPLVWIGAKRLRVESERASDDVVIANGVRASSYASNLLDMVRSNARRRVPRGAVAMAQSSDFEGRLLAILRPRTEGRPFSKLAIAGVVLAVAAAVVPLAALEPGPAAPSQEERTPALSSDTSGLPELVEAMLEDADAGVRAAAARSLGERGERRAVRDLALAASDRDPEVRLSAVWALNELQDLRGLAALLRALTDESTPVRRMAARALGDLDLQAPPPELLVATRDPDPMVRRMALWAVGELRPDGP